MTMPSPDPPATEPGPDPTPPSVPAAAASRRALVVLGMHRSGTSAVAGCLQRQGVDFGPRLMPPTPDNPRGFYEHIDIVNLHDRLLLAVGSSWDDTNPQPPGWLAQTDTARFRKDLREILRRDFGSAPLWGLKDPRLCRLLPWWQPLWAELQTRPLFVFVLRDPREVAASLARRDGFSPGKAYRLWLHHMLEAERATRQSERVFLDFADLLADWRSALAPVRELMGELDSAPAEAPPGERFVDSTRSRANPLVKGGELPLWVEEVDAALRRERRGGRELGTILDRISGQVEAAQGLYGEQGEHADDLARKLTALQQQARWYEAEWQKARRRWQESRDQSERRQAEVLDLRSRILVKDLKVSVMRKCEVSMVRKGSVWMRGFLRRFLRR